MKLPSLQFYPGDWLQDSVAGCSLAAQGLWLRMIFIAHRSERYGLLNQGSGPMPAQEIARRCGTTVEEMTPLLEELRKAEVFSLENGIIFSRRMVRDHRLREIRRAAGLKGGNPNLLNQKSGTHLTLPEDEDSSVELKNNGELEYGGMQGGKLGRFGPSDIAAIYTAYPRKVGRAAASHAITRALMRLKDQHEDAASWLLERTQVYAQSPAGNAGTYTPHPATWFNQGRYDDDPHEWQKVKELSNGHPLIRNAITGAPLDEPRGV